MTAILDSSALLAFAYGEPGAEKVSAVLPEAAMSSVNAAEVASKLMERSIPSNDFDAVWTLVAGLARDFTVAHALRCGELRKATKAAGLSLGDRACLALAFDLEWPVFTADRAWKDLDIGIEIEVIR